MLAEAKERQQEIFMQQQRQHWLGKRVLDLDQAIAGEQEELLPVAQKRLKLLRYLNYVSESNSLNIKGRVACEMRTALDELVITELIFDDVLHTLDSAELAGLLSSFVSKGKLPAKQTLTKSLALARDRLIEITHKMAVLQEVGWT